MAINLTSILADLDTISDKLDKNVLIIAARKAIQEGLDSSEVTSEERDKIYANFAQEIALGLTSQAIALAKDIPVLRLEEKKIDAEKARIDAERAKINAEKKLVDAQIALYKEQLKEAKYKPLIALATLKKQYGYGGATETELGTSTNDGLIDEHAKGFSNDMAYKAVKLLSEQAAMLAQNDIVTPTWMTNVMKTGIELMTDNEINIP